MQGQMKAITKLLLIFFILFEQILSSCSSNMDPENTILIDDAEKIGSSQIIEMIEEVNLIKVETSDAILGRINKVIEHKDKIYLLHGLRKKQLTIINSKGELINTIDRIGSGPGEYKDLTDFALNEVKNWIIILDVTMKKLVIYGLDGHYIRDVKIDFFADKLAYFEDHYFLYTRLIANNISNGKEIIVLDSDFNLANSLLAYRPESILKLSTYNVFCKTHNKLYFSNIFKDSVFILDSEGSKLYQRLFTSENPLPKECRNDSRLYNEYFEDSKFYMGCFNVVYPHAMFYVMDQHQEHIHIYNLKNHQNLYTDRMNIFGRIYLREPKGVGESHFYFSRQADWILDNSGDWIRLLETYKNSEAVNVVRNLNIEDNPILVQIKLKNN